MNSIGRTCAVALLSVPLLGSVMNTQAETTNQSLLVIDSIRQSADSIASGTNSTALGLDSTASGNYSLAEGYSTTASGSGSHAEGSLTQATNLHAHAEGYMTTAGGTQSHAEGEGTIAEAKNSHAGGAYSRALPEHTNAFIHASGTGTNSYKDTLFKDTAHFERLATLSPANDNSNSVLARWEGDTRYINSTGDTLSGGLTASDVTLVPSGGFSSKLILSNSTGSAYISSSGSNVYVGSLPYYTYRIFHASNDGAGSGMDADVIDGLDSTAFALRSGDVISNYLVAGDGRFNGNTLLTFYDNNSGAAPAYNYIPSAMFSRGSTNSALYQTQAGLVVYNDNGGSNRWAKMAFAAREGDGSGNAVAIAGIAGQMKNTVIGNWAVGDLILWTKNSNVEDERMRVKGATGFVGIGTNEPLAQLDVAGVIRGSKLMLGTSQYSSKLSLGTDLANTKVALYDDPSFTYGLGIQANQLRLHVGSSSDRFSFLSSAAGTELFTIKGTGNVGIATNTPAAKLDVNGDGRFASGVRFPAQGDISMGSYTNGAY